MNKISRREFGALALLTAGKLSAKPTGIDQTLSEGIVNHKIPFVAAMVASGDKTLYSGAFGTGVKTDSIFQIASMTKAITSVAAMQLVERGKLSLDEPAAKHLPQLAKLDILEGFDNAGKPVLRPNTKPITLRHLLTHTSGFAYSVWHEGMFKYGQVNPVPPGAVAPIVPLAFEPGTRWQYGYSADWTGKLVEAVSGLSLEDYFQKYILKPLDMNDTTFILPKEKFDRLVTVSHRQNGGPLQENPRTMPAPPRDFNGGGGLFSTTGDYIKFTQMILRYGRAGIREEILKARSVEQMSMNQIGDLGAGKLKSYIPNTSSDVDVHPGAVDKWGLGFLINATPYDGGRSAGSLAWAGIYNTFYWIDPARGISAVIMMQFLPFVDKEAVAVLGEFERSVYANL